MSLHEIVLPETKPETEWVRGRALQKVRPTYSHSRLQYALMLAIQAWHDEHPLGRFGPEWRFRVTPPGEITRPLVPDVGYLAYADLPQDTPAELVEVPLATPTVAFEVRSPDDRRSDVDDKIATYLAAGSAAVVFVEPQHRCVIVHTRAGASVHRFGDPAPIPGMPEFELDVEALFARALGD